MIKKIFIAGLAAIIPLVVTIYVLVAIFNFADGILGRLINKYLFEHIGYKIPGLGIIFSVLIVFLAGLLIRLSRMRLYKWGERMLLKLPLVNKIYFPVKKIFDFLFFPGTQEAFKAAVLVEYPRKGLYSLGFITNDCFSGFAQHLHGRKFYNVFLPTTPSPLTGVTVLAEEKEVIFLELSIEEALKFIVSGGLVNPYEVGQIKEMLP